MVIGEGEVSEVEIGEEAQASRLPPTPEGPSTLQTLQIQSVTAITSMGTKLSTVSSLCHVRGHQESSNLLNEPVTSLEKIIIE